jgi:hypothetical protein
VMEDLDRARSYILGKGSVEVDELSSFLKGLVEGSDVSQSSPGN